MFLLFFQGFQTFKSFLLMQTSSHAFNARAHQTHYNELCKPLLKYPHRSNLFTMCQPAKWCSQAILWEKLYIISGQECNDLLGIFFQESSRMFGIQISCSFFLLASYLHGNPVSEPHTLHCKQTQKGSLWGKPGDNGLVFTFLVGVLSLPTPGCLIAHQGLP